MNAIIIDDDQLDRTVMRKLLEKFSFIKVTGDFPGPLEAMGAVQTGEVDLIILDIEMPEMTGLEFLKNCESDPLVILATSSPDHALEAIECNVVDYILKPIQPDRLLKALNRAAKAFEARQHGHVMEHKGDDSIFIRDKGVIQRLRTGEIHFVQAMDDYVVIYTSAKRFTVRSSMSALEEKLPANGFIRTHRSYIVALNMIETIEENSMEIDGRVIPLSEKYRANFYKQLNMI